MSDGVEYVYNHAYVDGQGGRITVLTTVQETGESHEATYLFEFQEDRWVLAARQVAGG